LTWASSVSDFIHVVFRARPAVGGAPTCKKVQDPFEPTENQLGLLNLSPHDIGDKGFYYGRGCANCNDTGYKGRRGYLNAGDQRTGFAP